MVARHGRNAVLPRLSAGDPPVAIVIVKIQGAGANNIRAVAWRPGRRFGRAGG